MDDVRGIPPEPAGETAKQRFKRRLLQRPPPGLSEEGRRWAEANKDAIQAWNDWVEENGLPGDALNRD